MAVTNEPADVKAAAFSSDGFQICYGAANGELRCVDRASGQSRAVVAAASDVRLDGTFYVPGARSVLPGVGLQNVTIRLGGPTCRCSPDRRPWRNLYCRGAPIRAT